MIFPADILLPVFEEGIADYIESRFEPLPPSWKYVYAPEIIHMAT
jgi:hypothetical protein